MVPADLSYLKSPVHLRSVLYPGRAIPPIRKPVHHLREPAPVNTFGRLASRAGPEPRSAADLRFAELEVLTINSQRERLLRFGGSRRDSNLENHRACDSDLTAPFRVLLGYVPLISKPVNVIVG